MGEVSEEIELDLGLSIGRSFKKSENPKPIEKVLVDSDPCKNTHAPSSTAVDSQTKREIHALRRQEAKRKREEKQQKRGQIRARNGEMCGSAISNEEEGNKIENSNSIHGGYAASSPCPIMQMRFPYPPIQYVPLSNGFAIPFVPCWAPNGGGGNKKQVAQPCRSFVPFQANLNSGVNLSNGCESEQNGSGGNRKASSNGSPMCSSSVVSDNRSSSHEGVNSSETRSHSSHSLPRQPQMADGAKLQFQHSASSNAMQASQNFVKAGPNEKAPASSMSLPNLAGPNEKAAASSMPRPNPAGHNEKAVPSSMSCSNSVLPNEKAAASSMLLPNPAGISEKAAASSMLCPSHSGPNEKAAASSMSRPNPRGTNVELPSSEGRAEAAAGPERQPSPAKNNPVSPPENQKETEGEVVQPSKPQTPSLPQMPCVSTTGSGPNGKTITGLLYRYTKTEVTIVCVCHGNSFSPAEFVAHAGGTDVSNPLKHITVVPSALG